MLLSEAITYGSTLRGESHSGPFVRVANSDELLSDVWGAACEAVHSPIAKRRWDKSDKLSYDADIEALRQIQQQYFAEYFKSPATCPGAIPRTYSQGGGRYTGRMSQGLNEVAVERETATALPAITTACPSITNLAELIEHMFYVHNWTREECAKAVADYEQYGSTSPLIRSFEHYQDEAVQRRVAQRLTSVARQHERQRQQRRAYFTN